MSIADDPAEAAPEPALGGAVLLARGVSRALGQLGCASLHEFSLASGRRADVIGLGRGGASEGGGRTLRATWEQNRTCP
jgi:hypothetical protein